MLRTARETSEERSQFMTYEAIALLWNLSSGGWQ
jgi:hypothetical protein